MPINIQETLMSNQNENPYEYFEHDDSPYSASQHSVPVKKDRSTTGLVLGLVSIVAWLIPIIGFPVTICGIIFSAKSLDTPGRGKAIAGMILSIIFLCLTILNSIIGAIIGFMNATQGM